LIPSQHLLPVALISVLNLRVLRKRIRLLSDIFKLIRHYSVGHVLDFHQFPYSP